MDLTEELILQHGRLSPYKGKIIDFTSSAEMENSLCGDAVRIEVKIDQGQVLDMVFSGNGCLISQSAASLLIGHARKVKNINKIKKFNKDTVLKLLGIKLTLARLKCALLSLQVLQKALINY